MQVVFSLLLISNLRSKVKSTLHANNLVYLVGQQRLGEGSEWDFWFSCSVEGSMLQWMINGTGYKVFNPRELQTVHRESLSTFNYTATLLSSRTVAGVHHLTSVLIVSLADNITINVSCVNDTGSKDDSNNRGIPTNQSMQVQSHDNVMQMAQLWNRTVVQDGTNTTTTCLMCGVEFNHQSWATNNRDFHEFNIQNEIGSQHSLLSSDNSFLRIQTILIALPPKRLISIILVTDSSVRNVTCKANGTSLSSDQLGNSEDINITDTVNVTCGTNATSLSSDQLCSTEITEGKGTVAVSYPTTTGGKYISNPTCMNIASTPLFSGAMCHISFRNW